MEILIGMLTLAVATVFVMGWWHGNTFVCVFMTLASVIAFAVLMAIGAQGGPVAVTWFAVLVIWAPHFWRRRHVPLGGC
jgi:hypothetical protein